MSSPYPLYQHTRCYHYRFVPYSNRITRILLLFTTEFLASSTVSSLPNAYHYVNERLEGVSYPHYEQQSQMVCNNGTDYQCICRTGVPEILTEPNIIECDQFIQSLELPVVDMRMRHVNLEAHLHTNEKYEAYFKRRIANIVSSYCEHQANECPGTTLRLTETTSDALQSEDDGDDKSVLYAAGDESEPLLTQNNVVLLRVEREPANVTRVLFVVTKSENVGSLNEQMIINPVKVKYILGSQAAPLARILGGIKLDSIRVSRIHRSLKPSETDNTKLITIISVVGTFFVICYIIGAIRLCRDARRRKRERKAIENMNGLTSPTCNPVPNYGSCQRKLSQNCAVLNVTNPLQEAQPTKCQEIDYCVNTYHQDEPHVLTERQAQLMFMCDPSQLPREPTFDFQTGLDNSEQPQSMKSSSTPEYLTEEEVSPSQKPAAPILNEVFYQKSSSNYSYPTDHVPNLVVVPSMSMESPITSENPQNIFATQLACVANEPESPPDRPASRRGSRVGDEVLDLREIIAPLENENNYSFELSTQESGHDEKEKNRVGSEMSPWSSGEGELDVYYKLSDDDDITHEDNWTVKSPENYPRDNNDYDSDSEADEEQLRCEADMDSYVYERLREELTPIPPPDS